MDILQKLVPTHYICNKFIEHFNKITILNNGSFGIHKYLENDYILFKTSNYVLSFIHNCHVQSLSVLLKRCGINVYALYSTIVRQIETMSLYMMLR